MTLPAVSVDDLRKLERVLHEEIPLTRAMGVTVAGFDAGELKLAAPLSPNLNHKHTAFGGSLNSVATLACWALLKLALADEEMVIVIQDSAVEYRAPVTGDFVALASMPDPRDFQRLRLRLHQRGIARIPLSAAIYANTVRAVEFTGRFVVHRRSGRT